MLSQMFTRSKSWVHRNKNICIGINIKQNLPMRLRFYNKLMERDLVEKILTDYEYKNVSILSILSELKQPLNKKDWKECIDFG